MKSQPRPSKLESMKCPVEDRVNSVRAVVLAPLPSIIIRQIIEAISKVAVGLSSWGFEPSQPHRIISGLNNSGDFGTQVVELVRKVRRLNADIFGIRSRLRVCLNASFLFVCSGQCVTEM